MKPLNQVIPQRQKILFQKRSYKILTVSFLWKKTFHFWSLLLFSSEIFGSKSIKALTKNRHFLIDSAKNWLVWLFKIKNLESKVCELFRVKITFYRKFGCQGLTRLHPAASLTNQVILGEVVQTAEYLVLLQLQICYCNSQWPSSKDLTQEKSLVPQECLLFGETVG